MRLMERVFRLRMSRELWAWKFLGSPFGDSVIIVAEHGGQIVGHCGGIRLDLRIEGETCPAFMGVDAMVASEYRGKGIFREMEILMDRKFLEQGAALVFSFANASSRRLLELYRLRKNLGEIESQTRVIHHLTFLLARMRARVRRGGTSRGPGCDDALPPFTEAREGDITMGSMDRFGGEVDDLCRRSFPSSRIMVARGRDYLNWRYMAHPGKRYEPILVRRNGHPVGLIVIGRLELPFRKGTVADCCFTDCEEDVLKFALNQIVDYVKGTDLESVTSWMPRMSPPGRVLPELGFIGRGSDVYLMAKVFDDSLRDIVMDRSNWYYTLGDCDAG
jgi:hypothetical protein